MNHDVSKERLTRNELAFRKQNEKAKRTMQTILTPDEPISFLCECADASCRERIALTAAQFTALHAGNRLFVIKVGHEDLGIENIVEEGVGFYVVAKFINPELF